MMKVRQVFCKKAIPLTIVILFIVVAFSPISGLNGGASTTHALNVKYTPQIAPSSGNSTSSNAGNVKYTLVLSNNSLLNGNVVDNFNGLSPAAVAYDPANQYVYVANFGSDNVTVINSATDTIVQSIAVGSYPYGVAYDPSNQYMYVTNGGSDNVTVINSATDTIVQSVTVGSGPQGVAYDPSNQYMYVTNSGSNSVSVINSATDTVVQNININIGFEPDGVAYDPANQYVYVTITGSDIVTVINSATDTIVQNITVGQLQEDVAYDPSNQYMYVTNYGSGNVTVINSTTDTIVQSIAVGYGPESVAYDPSNQYVYVANFDSGSLSIIGNIYNATYNATFTESGLPSGTSWYVHLNNCETLSSTTSTISFTLVNDSYFYTIGQVYGYSSNLTSGQIMVSGNNVQVSVGFTRNGAPVWAFDGEYANYTVSGKNGTKPVSGYIYEEISGVNTNYGTINSSVIGGVKGYAFSSQYENNTSWNELFNAFNSTDLSLFNQGKTPASVNESFGFPESVSTGISLRTGMGTFLTDRLDFTTNTQEYTLKIILYVDQYSGVLLGYTYSVGPINITLLLQSTNTNLSSGSSILRISVYPSYASVTVNGISPQMTSGSTSLSLSPGSYYVSVSSPGYVPELMEINMTSGRTEYLNVTLTRSTSPTYTISGYVSPGNASVVVDGYSASVNDSGYYSISLPAGTYVLSVTDTGYYSATGNVTLTSNMQDVNFTLIKEPTPTSSETVSNVTATGYNVTVSNIVSGNGNISVNYTATSNGTITVVLPYSQVKNATISDLLSSRLYINGVQYMNFTVAISSSDGSYSVILTVHNLTGDPTLVWLYSPLASPPTKTSSTPNSEIYYAIIGAIVVIAVIVGIVLAMRRR